MMCYRFDKIKKKDVKTVDFRTNLKNVDTKKFALDDVNVNTIFFFFFILSKFSLFFILKQSKSSLKF